MVRVEDGMKGVVEMTSPPGLERYVEALDKHQPDRNWEPIATRRTIHELGLVNHILDYLRKRA
jgi:hypothetical protein